MLPSPEAVVDTARASVISPTPEAPGIGVAPASTVSVVAPSDPSGSKTPETNLKAALDEERRMRKEEREARLAAEKRELDLQARVKALEVAPPTFDTPSDDLPVDELLKKKLDDQDKEIKRLARLYEMDRVVSQYPVIGDKRAEFETFCEDYPPNTGREKLAKIFMAEQGLLEAPPIRPGLERGTQGPKTAQPTAKFTAEEIDRMMKAEPRRFNKLIQAGVIKPEDIAPAA